MSIATRLNHAPVWVGEVMCLDAGQVLKRAVCPRAIADNSESLAAGIAFAAPEHRRPNIKHNLLRDLHPNPGLD
jgi:hypothetical protein